MKIRNGWNVFITDSILCETFIYPVAEKLSQLHFKDINYNQKLKFNMNYKQLQEKKTFNEGL